LKLGVDVFICNVHVHVVSCVYHTLVLLLDWVRLLLSAKGLVHHVLEVLKVSNIIEGLLHCSGHVIISEGSVTRRRNLLLLTNILKRGLQSSLHFIIFRLKGRCLRNLLLLLLLLLLVCITETLSHIIHALKGTLLKSLGRIT
jgi:hypothetical protein